MTTCHVAVKVMPIKYDISFFVDGLFNPLVLAVNIADDIAVRVGHAGDVPH